MSSRYKIFTALILILVFGFIPNAKAQPSGVPSQLHPLVLTNSENETFETQGSLYVIEDKERRYTFNDIISMAQNGQIKDYAYDKSVVSLGAAGNVHWVIIPVLNSSDHDIWMLDFGAAAHGRLGFANKAILYEPTSRQTFFNTIATNEKQDTPVFLPSKVPVNLTRGVPTYLILYIEGSKGSIVTFRPTLNVSLNTESTFKDLIPRSKAFFLVSAFILLTCFLYKRDWSLLGLSAMWMVFFINRNLLDHYILLEDLLGQVATPVFRLIFPLLLLIAFWLSAGSRERYPPSLFIGSGILFIVTGSIGMLLPTMAPTVSILLGYVPPMGIGIMICLMTWPFILARQARRNLSFALIATAMTFTSAWIALQTIGMISSVEWVAKISPWIMSITAFVTSLLQVKISAYKSFKTIEDQNADSTSSDDIREAREASEHKRLLQVLEQERSLMKELQLQEVKQTEEMRKAKESADEANVAKSAFLAVVSHEIRTPMTGVMGMVRLLLDTGLSREQKEYAMTIQDSGEALLALLNDILDFEKIESGKLELEKANFDLKRLLKGIHTLMNGHAASKNIELVLDMDDKLPDFVVGDPTRLRQVLLNLVNNAIKFTPRGLVTIQVKNLSAVENANSPVSQIYFGVQDSGIGISPESQKKIFTPFSQADSSINRKFGGTGLGLTICKRLIEAMGAAIGINSREGEGSTFFFTLPMNIATSEDKNLRPSTGFNDYSGKKLRVLVVDDNGINQKVIHGLLAKTGHQATLTSNADEAVREIQKSAYDLVLMDIELPGKSGLDATREIRSLPDAARSSVPIVAMTGNVRSEDIKKYFEGSMNDFLAKPVMPDSLLQILAKTAKHALANPKFKLDAIVTPASISLPVEDTAADALLNSLGDFTQDFSDDDDEDSFASAVREFDQAEEKKETAEESYLDETLIASLLKNLGVAQTKELLADFYAKTEELIAAMKDAFDKGDVEALRARAHELKGMAGNFGFKALSLTSAAIEGMARNAKEADLRPLLNNLPDFYRASVDEMSARMEK